jgi:hypothetical protein
MRNANDSIKKIAKHYGEAHDIPAEKIEELEKILYMAVYSDPKRARDDPRYINSVLDAARVYLQSPTSIRSTVGKRVKTRKISRSIWVLFLVILAGGIFGLVNSTVLPEIEPDLLRFLAGALTILVLVMAIVYIRTLLGAAAVILVSTWRLLGWLSQIVLPVSVIIGLTVVPAINMAYISQPFSLLPASVVSVAVGIVGGSSIASAGKLRKRGWWLFILAAFSVLASTTWSFINLSDVMSWERIFLCFVIAFIFAIRIALR